MDNTSSGKKATGNSKVMFLVLGAVVLGAAAIAFSMGSDNSSSTSSLAPGAVISQYQPVTVSDTALPPLGDGPTDTAIGLSAPALQGATFAGDALSISPGEEGNPIMLVFLAHWCPHCNREIPQLIKWKEQGLVPKDLRVVGITTASRNDQANWPPSEWITDMQWPFETMADSETGQASQAYGVDGFPFIVIVNSSGKVVQRSSGEKDVAQITSMVNDALALT